jgi:hypothetical protein
MVSSLALISMIFALFFNNYLAASAKYLDDNITNVYRNYSGFYIRSALKPTIPKNDIGDNLSN